MMLNWFENEAPLEYFYFQKFLHYVFDKNNPIVRPNPPPMMAILIKYPY